MEHPTNRRSGDRMIDDPGPARTLPLEETDRDTEALLARVFLVVLQHPDPSRSLLIAQGMAPEAIDRALTALGDQGLIRLHPGGSVEVIPPDISLPALALQYERRARETRSAAHELAQLYFAARNSSATADGGSIRILQSLDEVAAATAEIVASGNELVRTFRSLTPRTQEVLDSPVSAHEAPSVGAMGQVLEMRTVYESAVLELPGVLTTLAARERGGESFRFTTSIPFSAVVVDDDAAVVDVSGFDPSGRGSVLVRTRPMVQALRSLADHFWDIGSPLERGTGSAPSARDQTILALLAAGAPDATIARQTGVSQRTVERRVRALMDQLGAGTRFQAGVQAARRGLV
ncbi:MAG TPA: helix-turn-helix transcriptional regulator [Pedococcus sp.]|jgi:DNA-binding CsgD family transcriptional regulator|nr:helix-turn-helix transcriptional regulator [Pedococcus sp.]